MKFTIQVGAYRNLENAAAMKELLERNGFSPEAILNNQGITRIVLADIPEMQTAGYARKLEAIGISNIMIKQN